MKKLLIAFISLLSLCSSFSVLAQTKAPNDFSSKGYRYRLKSFTIYGQNTDYSYDQEGRMVEARTTQGEDLVTIDKFYYDEKGYLSKIDVYGRPRTSTGEFDIVSTRELFMRDDNGYLTKYERYGLLGEHADDEELTKVAACEIFYNDKMLPVKSDVYYLDQMSKEWFLYRKCEISYNKDNQVVLVLQKAPEEGGGEFFREEFGYDDQKRLVSAVASDEASGGPSGRVEFTYEYDEVGNLVKAGREFFTFKYKYNNEYPLEETFIPTSKTIANSICEEFLNCIAFSSFPMGAIKNGSKFAPIAEVLPSMDSQGEEEEAEIKYENNPTSILDIRKGDTPLQARVEGGLLVIKADWELIGSRVFVYDMAGVLVKSVLLSNDTAVEIDNLEPGCYILSCQGASCKFSF